jgi:ElaB/YqjD/DUF883 family membrane-anchored ribosome-binding protein
VENQVTTPGEQTPELMQEEMQQTRDSLTEKVAALEDQVVGTVQNAADTLTDTVAAVKSFVADAPGAVSDSVKEAASAVSEKVKEVFDVSDRVRDYPWRSVGVSAGLGFLAGLLVFRSREATRATPERPQEAAFIPPPMPPAPASPGMFDGVFAMLGQKLRDVTENLIDVATKAVNKTVSEGVPKLVDAATELATEQLKPDNEKFSDPFNKVGGSNGFNRLKS